jgi:hypothetical protein
MSFDIEICSIPVTALDVKYVKPYGLPMESHLTAYIPEPADISPHHNVSNGNVQDVRRLGGFVPTVRVMNLKMALPAPLTPLLLM